ncbi:DUF2934 domain-containing protein [Rhodocyclus tenuis]|uniref:DUF2934 domain-containing protein n=1 Tax=Rhodocyclus tenuis TaxID=1066 RepID=A0A840G832_RHOTE|nr:DUF2934 domain-containing protein [Rhodocyclus tenuis]MBB4248493.1 hypothetical protein [Rhodocyclus tenuis]
MEKSGSFSHKQRITRDTGSQTAASTADNSAIQQQIQADDQRYHAGKVALGSDGAHEGWIAAEEERMASKPTQDADSSQEWVAVAAYYIAEKRGFSGNEALADWLAAQAQIAELLAPTGSPAGH